MISMHTPLAVVQAEWARAFPAHPFPGKIAAVAALSKGAAPTAAPAAAPVESPKLDALSVALEATRKTVAQIDADFAQRLASTDETITRLDDRLTGEIQGLGGQLTSVSASIAALDSTLRNQRPAVDPVAVAGQVAAAVRDAFEAYRPQAVGREAEALAIADAQPIGSVDPSVLFGLNIRTAKGSPVSVMQYAAPTAEAPDPLFIWTEGPLRHLIHAERTGQNVWLGGPKGTGKTETVRQYAARTGRPFCRINFHKYSTAEEIIGATGLNNGSTGFQPGPFLQAFTTPGCVILLDEPTNADPGELAILNGLLEPTAAVTIGGTVWRRAPGVMICAADNTLTNGDSSGRYAGTRQMNSAFADRFGSVIAFDYLPLQTEIDAIVKHTGCNPPLAEHVMQAITVARSKVSTGDIIDAPSIRSVIAFIRALDMFPVREAWNCSIAARQPEESALALAGIFEACINESFITTWL